MGFANSRRSEVLLIQECYHNENKIWAVPSKRWQTFQSNNKTIAVIVTRSDIQAVCTYKDSNSVFINITTVTGTITVGSAYSPPKGNFATDMEWLNFFDPLQTLILGTDLNVRSSFTPWLSE